MIVILTWFEMFVCAQIGCMRQIEALKLGRPDRHGYNGDGWNVHIHGALAECAVAKAQGRYWEPLARRPHELAGDVADLQVRSTQHRDGSLILHPDDPDDARFWLVITSSAPRFNVVGSIDGAAGKLKQYWRTDVREPAFFVPQAALA